MPDKYINENLHKHVNFNSHVHKYAKNKQKI